MPDHVVIFDCEHLTERGAPGRFWCGPDDPDPLLVQIGAVKLYLTGDYPLGEVFDCLVRPIGRAGPVPLPEFFTKLTGITEDRVARSAQSLEDGLAAFADFCGEAPIFSWGKDEITSLAPACFVAEIVSPLPASRFRNAAGLLRDSGVPRETVHGLRSHTLAAHFGLAPEQAHDGLGDARAVARVLQHLLRAGRLTAAMLGPT